MGYAHKKNIMLWSLIIRPFKASSTRLLFRGSTRFTWYVSSALSQYVMTDQSLLCTFPVWTTSFQVWTRPFQVWTTSFQMWTTSFQVWTTSFQVWTTSFRTPFYAFSYPASFPSFHRCHQATSLGRHPSMTFGCLAICLMDRCRFCCTNQFRFRTAAGDRGLHLEISKALPQRPPAALTCLLIGDFAAGLTTDQSSF